MRIISGKWKGRSIKAPKNLPVRPTTDYAKEALFSLLQAYIDFDDALALDLFSGTGNLSFELVSRGCQSVLSVDMNPLCVKHIQDTVALLQCNDEMKVLRRDIFSFLKKEAEYAFDIIVCDPPYNHLKLASLPNLIFEHDWLKDDGILVLEHGKEHDFKNHPKFDHHRNYGHVNFTFFKK